MSTKRTALLVATTLALSACGTGEGGGGPDLPEDPSAPVIQITSEGGFAPVDMILGRGPGYTLLSDGRLIYEGPTIAIFPGPLVPNYQVTTIDDQQMQLVLDLVDQMGLPEMDRKVDDSAASRVADATTEVITYWDTNGEHVYAVYALGIDLDQDPAPATAAFAELLGLMGDLISGEAVPYEPDRVRIVAGPGYVNEEFEDIRAWPLGSEGMSDWDSLPNGWMCQVFDPGVLAEFIDATQVTVWESPNTDLMPAPVKLLVRPLHPGEPDCPTD